MEDVNSTSQSTDVEQPHHPVNHSRPFFYVQPPSQPYFMCQWPMDPFGQYGFPGPVFPFGRPFMAPYQYMQYPGYVVPHAPMQPTDYRRMAPFFPSVASYDLRFRQHFQQMSVHRDTTSSEAQTEPGDPISKLADSLDGLQDTEKSGAVKESNVMLSSTPAIICYTQEVEKLSYGDAKPASELAKSEQDEGVKPVTFCDSAVYDAESSHGRLEECALSGVLPLDSSSVHEEGQGLHDQLRDTETACLQSAKSDGNNDPNTLTNMKSLNLAVGLDSGACISEISEKSYPFEGEASDQGKQSGNLSPKSVGVVEPPVQTALDHDLAYQILRLPCNKTTTGLVLQKEVNPLVYLDTTTPLLPPKRHSLGNAYPYSYYPQVAQERQSVLSPSLDELSSRDEMFSTDMEDELVAGQVYMSGGKLAETSAVTTHSDEDHRDDACSVCAKTCACCGVSLPDEDETILAERYGYLEKDVVQELSDQDCECELEEHGQVPGTFESQKLALRQQAPRPALTPCGWQTAKHKTRKVQDGAELSEQDQGHGTGECGELLHAPAKVDRVKGKGQKGGQSRSYSEHQCREGRQGDVLDQDSWTSCSGKQKSRSCRPTNGLQEKGRPGRRRSYCKMFAQQRPKRNEYDDNDEAEFSHCQRGRGSMKRRGTRY